MGEEGHVPFQLWAGFMSLPLALEGGVVLPPVTLCALDCLSDTWPDTSCREAREPPSLHQLHELEDSKCVCGGGGMGLIVLKPLPPALGRAGETDEGPNQYRQNHLQHPQG